MLASGGAAMILTGAASWSVRLTVLGFGLLLYALVEAPGHYLATGQRPVAALLRVTLLGVAPAIVLAIV